MLYCIIVSHHHDDFIVSNAHEMLCGLSGNIKMIVKDNVNSEYLNQFCKKNDIIYIATKIESGFGRNNNEAVSYIENTFGINNDDYFLFINPDVVISSWTINDFYSYVCDKKILVSTIDLFKDEEFNIRDNFIREFPNILDFASSLLLNKNKTVLNRELITKPVKVSWCAGSFICINAITFTEIYGFDESFYMYCEDVDLCYRLYLKNTPIYYLPQFRAIHIGMHANRKIFSRAFIWHVNSSVKFLFKKYCFRNYKSYSKKVRSIIRG